MNRVLAAAACFTLLYSACSKKKDSGGGGGGGGSKAAFSADQLLASTDLVKAFDKFDEALPRIEAKLGKAQHISTAGSNPPIIFYFWALTDGDKCHQLAVEKSDDGNVGIVEGPKSLSKDDGIEYDTCVAATQDKEYKATE